MFACMYVTERKNNLLIPSVVVVVVVVTGRLSKGVGVNPTSFVPYTGAAKAWAVMGAAAFSGVCMYVCIYVCIYIE